MDFFSSLFIRPPEEEMRAREASHCVPTHIYNHGKKRQIPQRQRGSDEKESHPRSASGSTWPRILMFSSGQQLPWQCFLHFVPFFWCIVAAASDNISFHSLTCHQVFSSLCFVSRQALDAGCKHGKSENDYYWILFPVLKKALKDFNNPELKWHLWRSGAVVCTLSSKWKKVPGLDALVLFCVEFALPPHLQGLGMQSSFRVLQLSYVNCWF